MDTKDKMLQDFHFYIQRLKRVNSPVERKITPLIGGIHLPKGRKARTLETLAAAVPANKRGMTWPEPKKARSKMPINGLPFLATHPSNTAKTGVVHGEDANPNIIPAAMGANGFGIFPSQASGWGPLGRVIFRIPKTRPTAGYFIE